MRGLLRSVIFILVAGMGFLSCTKKVAPANAEVNAALEMIPPVAENITLKLLEKSVKDANVLVSARFDTNLIQSRFHAVFVNGEKLVMRDDGEGGDVKAGDGVFSIALKEDVSQLTQQLDSFRLAAVNAVRQKKNLFRWINRSGVIINDEIFKAVDQKFDLSQGIIFNPGFIFTIPPDPLLKDHSLIVNNTAVVEDPVRTFNPCLGIGAPDGAWTFGKLISDMANTASTGISAENFIKDWLETWLSPQTVNGDVIADRATNMFTRVIKPWVEKSNPAVPPATIAQSNWKTFPLDLKIAPFKLLAIVNRIDLRGNSGYSMTNAGEGRFVFGVLNSGCSPLAFPGKFTVIFEYGLPFTSCETLKNYAQQWVSLKTLTPGTPAYNTALQAITDQFTAANAGGTKANGSCLNQVRTNELAIGDPWELREFNIDKGTHKLLATTVKKEPAKVFNRLAKNVPALPPATANANIKILADYVNNNQTDVRGNRHKVPLTISGINFLGGKAHTETAGHFWDANDTVGIRFINDDLARHVFSLNTCSGCHGGEGKTSIGNSPGFLHVGPQPFGAPATLSAFLLGDASRPDKLFQVTDPAGRPTGAPTVRGFNDLERRAVDLQSFVSIPCLRRVPGLIEVLSFKPVNMTH